MLEDLDADAFLNKCVALKLNKPTTETLRLYRATCGHRQGQRPCHGRFEEGRLEGCDGRLDQGRGDRQKDLIDQHYYAIASKATIWKPEQLNVAEDSLRRSLACPGRMLWPKISNAMDGCAKLGLDADQSDSEWANAKRRRHVRRWCPEQWDGKPL